MNLSDEKRLLEEDPIRRDLLNKLLQIKREENPNLQLPDNIEEFISKIERTAKDLSPDQKEQLERLFSQPETDLSSEEQENLVNKILKDHFPEEVA